jgi:circadian clock protein KaiC
MHLVALHRQVNEVGPRVVVVDPVSSLLTGGSLEETTSLAVRVVDYLKARQITAVFTSLAHAGDAVERSELALASLIDTWLLLRDVEVGGERNRGLYVLKSRGMAHSNQVREFLMSDKGIDLRDVYVGPEGVLTGSMRLAQEAREKAAALTRQQEIERRTRELERKRRALEAQISAQRAQFETEQEEIRLLLQQEKAASDQLRDDETAMGRSRRVDASDPLRGPIRSNPRGNSK